EQMLMMDMWWIAPGQYRRQLLNLDYQIKKLSRLPNEAGREGQAQTKGRNGQALLYGLLLLAFILRGGRC
ncbi:MAG TPA: hypothetical protein VK074_08375, partial [Fodinibius sp.]|nr:hypothetical protein [Fodinibius sp.]